jgi:hypothetical protein
MEHIQRQLVRERQRSMLDAAAAQRDGNRAAMYRRIARRAERAERRQLSHGTHVARLRAELAQIEAVS